MLLRASHAGADVPVLERDASPAGSTSLSSGFVPAGGTRFQRDAGINGDSAAEFATDIQSKSHGLSHAAHVQLACEQIAPAWLARNAATSVWASSNNRVRLQILVQISPFQSSQ